MTPPSPVAISCRFSPLRLSAQEEKDNDALLSLSSPSPSSFSEIHYCLPPPPPPPPRSAFSKSENRYEQETGRPIGNSGRRGFFFKTFLYLKPKNHELQNKKQT